MLNLPGSPPTATDVRRLVEGSWLTPDLIEAACIRRVDHQTAVELIGGYGRAGEYQGLAIPYFWPGGNRVREYRLRRDRPDIEYKNGKRRDRQKYVAPPGRGNMLYFPPGIPPDALSTIELPIAIVEGEKKALALQRLATWNREKPRWLAIGLSGVWNWRGVIGKEAGPDGERRSVKGVIGDFDYIEWDSRAA